MCTRACIPPACSRQGDLFPRYGDVRPRWPQPAPPDASRTSPGPSVYTRLAGVGGGRRRGPGAVRPWELKDGALVLIGPGASPAWGPGRSVFDAFALWKFINPVRCGSYRTKLVWKLNHL